MFAQEIQVGLDERAYPIMIKEELLVDDLALFEVGPVYAGDGADDQATLAGGVRRGWLQRDDGRYRLTPDGDREAARVVRNHRLWEIFLITHAEIAPSHVDRDADLIEHVLGPEMLGELEQLLAEGMPDVPPSPHAVTGA